MKYYKYVLTTAVLSAALTACSGSKETAATRETSPPASAVEAAHETPRAQAQVKALTKANDEAAVKARLEAKASAAKDADIKQAEAKDAANLARAEAEAQILREDQQRQAEQEAKADAKDKAAREAAQQAERDAQARRAERAQIEQDQIEQAQVEQAQATQIVKEAPAPEITTPVTTAVNTPPPITEAATPPEPAPQPAPKPAGINTPYNNFLAKYVKNENGIHLIAYDKVTAQDRAALQSYINSLSQIDIEALPRDAEMATWFNLYNAKTIELILENYPIKSIRKISNPWKKKRLVVNGKKMSLDDIEHNTVRRKYDEPRVHYAFNCASIGCPNVKSTAWEAESLEADLTQAARDFIASERGVEVRDNKIIASSIFKWYKKDFGGNEDGILAHLRRYASGSKKAALDATSKINKYDYDWDLNIQP